MSVEQIESSDGSTLLRNLHSGRVFRVPDGGDYYAVRKQAARAGSQSETLAQYEVPRQSPRERIATLTPHTTAAQQRKSQVTEASEAPPYVPVSSNPAFRARKQREFDAWQERELARQERAERREREAARDEQLASMQAELATLRQQTEPQVRPTPDAETIERYRAFDDRRADAMRRSNDRSLPADERRKAMDEFLAVDAEEFGVSLPSAAPNVNNAENGEN